MNGLMAKAAHCHTRAHEETFTGTSLLINNTVNAAANVTVYGKSEQVGTPTPEAPVAINSVAGDIVIGTKNILPYPYYQGSGTRYGVVWTVNSDGSIVANGTATSPYSYIRLADSPTLKAGAYTLSGRPSGGSSDTYRISAVIERKGGTLNYASDFGNGVTFTLNDGDAIAYIEIRISAGTTVSNMVFLPQLEYGNVKTSRVPYKSSSATLPTLRKCGTVADTYNPATGEFVQGTNVYVHNTDFTGWGCTIDANDATNLTAYFWRVGRITPLYNTDATNSFCSHFQIGLPSSNETTERYGVFFNQVERLRINKSTIGVLDTDTAAERVTKLVAWLQAQNTAGTPLTLLYQRATPVTTYLTPAQLSTYYPHTNITTDGEIKADLSATVKIIGI